MRTKITVALLLCILAFYCVLVIAKGIDLLQDGGAIRIALGLALIVSAALGIGLAWREVQFGRRTAVLGRALEAEGGLPVDDLPRRPSGRVDRAAADEVFAVRRAEAEHDPENWRAWFRLAIAYDMAGDRTRARAAARHAIELYG